MVGEGVGSRTFGAHLQSFRPALSRSALVSLGGIEILAVSGIVDYFEGTDRTIVGLERRVQKK